MADAKISALTALTGANIATDDEMPIVDTSVTTTKKTTMADLSARTETLTNKTIAAASNTLTNVYQVGGTDVAIADGGTAASTVAAAQTNLNIIPVDVAFLNRFIFSWTNQPAAETEMTAARESRKKVDLTNAGSIRMVVGVTTASASANTPVTYFNYATTDTVPTTALTSNRQSLAAAGTFATAWEAVPAGAKADVWVSIIGSGGDGVADPAITQVALQVK